MIDYALFVKLYQLNLFMFILIYIIHFIITN